MTPREKRALTTRVRGSLARRPKELEKAKEEVLERGSKHVRPLLLSRHRVLKLTIGLLVALVVAFVAAIGVMIYGFKSDNALVYRVSRIVPFPAARINGNLVSYADYLFEVRYNRKIYENPGGPTTASQQKLDLSAAENQELLHQIQRGSLDRAKYKVIIRRLARDNNVKVTESELNAAIDQLVTSQGGQAKFESAIKQFYGWDMNDFRKEYSLQLLSQKLPAAVLGAYSPDQKRQAEDLLAKARAGEDFAALAKASSADPGSKDNGGDLGFVNQDTNFVPEFKEAALKLEKGQVSDLVSTSFGFHIIKAFDKNDQGVKVSHILIAYAKDIDTLLQEQLAQAKVNNFIRLPEAPAQSGSQ